MRISSTTTGWMAALLCVALGAAPAHAAPAATPAKLGTWFEANQGQAPADLGFVGRARGRTLGLGADGVHLAVGDAPVRMVFAGGTAPPRLEGREPLASRTNYLRGNDRAQWQVGVPHFARVRYVEAWRGIDVEFREGGSDLDRQLEYDFLLAPGADPARIALRFDGAERVAIDASGDLVIHAGGGELRQRAPLVYQERDGRRSIVASHYATARRRAGRGRARGLRHDATAGRRSGARLRHRARWTWFREGLRRGGRRLGLGLHRGLRRFGQRLPAAIGAAARARRRQGRLRREAGPERRIALRHLLRRQRRRRGLVDRHRRHQRDLPLGPHRLGRPADAEPDPGRERRRLRRVRREDRPERGVAGLRDLPRRLRRRQRRGARRRRRPRGGAEGRHRIERLPGRERTGQLLPGRARCLHHQDRRRRPGHRVVDVFRWQRRRGSRSDRRGRGDRRGRQRRRVRDHRIRELPDRRADAGHARRRTPRRLPREVHAERRHRLLHLSRPRRGRHAARRHRRLEGLHLRDRRQPLVQLPAGEPGPEGQVDPLRRRRDQGGSAGPEAALLDLSRRQRRRRGPLDRSRRQGERLRPRPDDLDRLPPGLPAEEPVPQAARRVRRQARAERLGLDLLDVSRRLRRRAGLQRERRDRRRRESQRRRGGCDDLAQRALPECDRLDGRGLRRLCRAHRRDGGGGAVAGRNRCGADLLAASQEPDADAGRHAGQALDARDAGGRAGRGGHWRGGARPAAIGNQRAARRRALAGARRSRRAR